MVGTVRDAGAPHVSFNPLTERVCVKEANRILKAARYDLPEADVRGLVQEVHCDLRNTIQALQLRLVGQRPKSKGAGAKASKIQTAAAVEMHSRDMGLNFFHALGRILYNKRFNALGELIKAGEQCAPLRCSSRTTCDQFHVSRDQGVRLCPDGPVGGCQLPLEPEIRCCQSHIGFLFREAGAEGKPADQGQPLMPAEEVVSRSGLGAQVIISFLFEHYLHMISPEAIEDAAASAEKFSDAMFMLGRGSHDTGTFGAPPSVSCSPLLLPAQ